MGHGPEVKGALAVKLFIDSANLKQIKEADALGIADGVTTNPTLVSKEEQDFKSLIQDICAVMGDRPVSAEGISTDTEGMLKEARTLAKWAPNVVVKIPMTADGLKAVRVLSQEEIKTNVTLIFTANQALLAAKAGATYVSPFMGRLDDIDQDGLLVVKDTAAIFENYDIRAEIIAASVRHPLHVSASAKAKAHIATVPPALIHQMIRHPLTEAGIKRFFQDWEKAKQQKDIEIER